MPTKAIIANMVYQVLGIAVIVITVLAIPIKMRFNYVEARQGETIASLQKHFEDHKELEKNIPDEKLLNFQYENINDKLDSLSTQLEACRDTDKEFREQLYKYFTEKNN